MRSSSFFLLSLALLSWGCGVLEPSRDCGPQTCDGCCDEAGMCRPVNVPLCSAPGSACRPECLGGVAPGEPHVDAGAPAGDAGTSTLRMFTSGAAYRGDLTIAAEVSDPLAAADRLCQRMAEAEALSGTWMAFITADGGHPADRFPAEGPWRHVRSSAVLFKDKAALKFTAPPSSLAFDERGGVISASANSRGVWTGVGTASNCGEWSTALGAVGTYGTAGTPSGWYGGTSGACDSPRSLYCFEQARTLPDGGTSPALPDAGARRAFVTSLSFNGDLGGIDGGHARCDQAAAAAGLGGVWRAWLGGRGRPAGSDFTFSGPWSRVGSDGGTAVASLETLRVGILQQLITVDELGRPMPLKRPWTAAYLSVDPPNCADWTSTSDAGHVGDTSSRTNLWHDYQTVECSSLHPLYCFEQ